jgi:nucleotide-binding universal stress UspA family protein
MDFAAARVQSATLPATLKGFEMPIKTMLVHVDDSTASKARVRIATRVARDIDARLIGTYLVPTAEITPAVAALIPRDVLARRMTETGRAQQAAEALFRRAAADAGVTAIEWRAPTGSAVNAGVVHGRYCDLMVVGQPDADDPFVLFANEILTATLVGLGHPILVVPYIGAQGPLGKRILVATDGGREASRAIGDAMFLLEHASNVRVVVGIAQNVEAAQNFDQTSACLTGWFRDHSINPEVERYDVDVGDHGAWLLSRASDFGADLIVMGGYGHTRLREIVLGGMTRTILQTMTVPVLMAH